jgi:predicted P-loop ATPase
VVVLLPDLPEKGDLTDYLDRGGSVKSVAEMIRTAIANPGQYGIDQLPKGDETVETVSDQPDEPPAPPPPIKPALARRFDAVKGIVGDNLRLNLLTKEIELDGKPLDRDALIIRLACDYCVHVPDNHADKICAAVAREYAYHPVVDYLKEVNRQHGTDTTILNNLTERYFGTNHPLHQIYLRKWLISAVRRVFDPGCKVDTALILQGGQGTFKSTFFKTLASARWFDDSMGSSSDKDERLKMHMVWVVEWAELESVFKRKDIGTIKAFITTETDLIRAPYDRSTSRYPRHCVIVGTTNQEDFLADPTGDRRFWVIPAQSPIPIGQLKAERDRIWAAAVAASDAGEEHFLTKEEQRQSSELNAGYALTDPWDTLIESYLEPFIEITTHELLTQCLKIPIERLDRAAEMRVSRKLKRLGWDQSFKKIDGRAKRIWAKK